MLYGSVGVPRLTNTVWHVSRNESYLMNNNVVMLTRCTISTECGCVVHLVA